MSEDSQSQQNNPIVTDKDIKEARARLWAMGILEWKLDITQKKIYDFYNENPNKTITINASRRLGKSYLLTIMAIEQCIKKPKSIVKFLQPEVKMIRTNIRPVMAEILDDCPKELRPEFKTQDNMYVFPNGSEIHLAGTDNGNHEKLRGGNSHFAIIDEAGFCSELQYIVNSILIPTTTLTKGRIILSSTTPPNPDHEFITYMNSAEKNNSLIRKTILDAVEDNKELPNPRLTEEIVADIVKSMPNGAEDDAFRTEYLCVDKNTKIRTSTGYKPIQDITVGEEVLTHKGRFKKVKNVFKNKLDSRPVYKIKCSNTEGFVVTEGHQLFVEERSWKNKVMFEGWKTVESIDMDAWTKVYFKNPIVNIEQHEVDPELAYLCGWFVAEGHVNKTQQQSIFSLAKSDPVSKLSDISRRLFGKSLIKYDKKENVSQYGLNSKKAKEIFSKFGHLAHNKYVSDFIKYSNKESKIQFLKGLFEGDGCLREGKTGNTLSLSTVSYKLAYDVSEMFLSLGIVNSVSKNERPATCIIEGRTVNQRSNYEVKLTGDGYNKFCNIDKKVNQKHRIEDGTFLSKIYSIERIEYSEEYVYDIEVEEDHSYSSLHGTFHNCEVIFNSEDAVVPEFIEAEKDVVTIWPKPSFYDKYVAMDIGFVDLTVVLFGFWDFDNGVLVIEDEFVINGHKLTTTTLAENIKAYEERLWTNPFTGEFEQPYRRVSDNNLIVINDLQRDHGLTFLPTDKANKDANINALRNMISARQIAINPKCKTLISHLKSATWDKSHKSFRRSADNAHFDAVDSLTYMVRNIDKSRSPYPKGYRHSQIGSYSSRFVSPHAKDEANQSYEKLAGLFKRKK